MRKYKSKDLYLPTQDIYPHVPVFFLDIEIIWVQLLFTEKSPVEGFVFYLKLGILTWKFIRFKLKTKPLQNNTSTTVIGKRIFTQNLIIYHSCSGFKDQHFLGLSSFGELIIDNYF